MKGFRVFYLDSTAGSVVQRLWMWFHIREVESLNTEFLVMKKIV